MATQQRRKSSMPKREGQAGLGDALDLSGLTDTLGGLLGGVVGGVGKTVSGVTGQLGETLGEVLGSLLTPLQQLQQQAAGGSEEAAEVYGQAVSMLQKASKKGKTDAQALLQELGEALDESPEEEIQH